MSRLTTDFKKVIKLHWRDRNRKSWLYCPACHHDLNGDKESFMFERLTNINGQDESFWFFTCANCGCQSQWLLDAFPMPVVYARQYFDKELMRVEL